MRIVPVTPTCTHWHCAHLHRTCVLPAQCRRHTCASAVGGHIVPTQHLRSGQVCPSGAPVQVCTCIQVQVQVSFLALPLARGDMDGGGWVRHEVPQQDSEMPPDMSFRAGGAPPERHRDKKEPATLAPAAAPQAQVQAGITETFQ